MNSLSPSKVAFITGCSSGLGFATVLKLINAGYTVYATMRSLEKKIDLEKACNFSPKLFILEVNLLDYKSIEFAVDTVLLREQRIDVVIHNAAAALLGTVDSTTSSELENLFKVNVFAVHKLTQLFIPFMRAQMNGHFLFISSISGIESSGCLGAYASTKFAIEALAASLATTLHKWNIKCTILEPGAINTSLPENIKIGSFYDKQPSNPYENFNKNALDFLKTCLKNGISPNEVANQILEILNYSMPHLKYQTCDYSKQLAQRHLKDPEGDTWVDEHRKFLENFY